MTYKPGHRAHLVMQCLDQGAVTLKDVRRALDLPQRRGSRAFYLVEALRDDGLATRRVDGFHLTYLGRQVLDQLARGCEVEVGFRQIMELAA